MPLYVYEPVAKTPEDAAFSECCSFEFLQSLSEPALTQCPDCGHPVQRALTSFGFSVRGASQASTGAKETKPIFGPSANANTSSDSRAGRVARLAANHVCGLGCKH